MKVLVTMVRRCAGSGIPFKSFKLFDHTPEPSAFGPPGGCRALSDVDIDQVVEYLRSSACNVTEVNISLMEEES